MEFTELRVCRDLRGVHVTRAIGSRQATIELLRHLASISAPGTGAATVLLVFARMGTNACEWLEGALRVELNAEPDGTRVDVATDLGGGARERILPSFVMRAPIEEFSAALQRVPRLAGILGVQGPDDRHLVLSASAETRMTSAPPPSIQIAPDSLYTRAPAPPRAPTPVDKDDAGNDLDGGWDE